MYAGVENCWYYSNNIIMQMIKLNFNIFTSLTVNLRILIKALKSPNKII